VQTSRIALVGITALTLAGTPVGACPNAKFTAAKSYAPIDNGGETIRKVSRGATLAIACDGVDLSALGDVRVVLTFSQTGAKQLGYKGVLATDQSTADGKLQIRMPDAPDFANHTVNVKVFMMSGDSAKSCDAGKVRVV
jgi:hypothetical protein